MSTLEEQAQRALKKAVLENHRGRFWITRDQERIRIAEMTNNHLVNLWRYLQQRMTLNSQRRDETAEELGRIPIVDGRLREITNLEIHLGKLQRFIDSDASFRESLTVEIVHRGLDPDRMPPGPSPLTAAEIDFLFYRMVGWNYMVLEENWIVLGAVDEYPLECPRYAIAQEMRERPLTQREIKAGGWIPPDGMP